MKSVTRKLSVQMEKLGGTPLEARSLDFQDCRHERLTSITAEESARIDNECEERDGL